MQLRSRRSSDPSVCHGKPCIRGHRIWVSLILDLMAVESYRAKQASEQQRAELALVPAAVAGGVEAEA